MVGSILRRLAFAIAIALSIGIAAKAQTTIAPVVERVLPTVVSIAVRGTAEEDGLLTDPLFKQLFGVPEGSSLQRGFQAAGCGVIVNAAKGYILTNSHVIENATEIRATVAAGVTYRAKVVGSDPDTDIAVIKIEAPNLQAIDLGESAKLHVGDYVAAIGNPFGLGQTVTLGIISALGRGGLGIDGYENFIQTDASINPGNSGGALIDMNGRLIGINSAIIGPSGGNVGIGFAIPVAMAKSVMDVLIRDGAVHRGMLGVVTQDLTPELAKALDVSAKAGAVISQVNEGSPGERAGLRAGDVVTEIEKRTVSSATDLQNIVGSLPPGKTVGLAVARGRSDFHLSVLLGEKLASAESSSAKELHQGQGFLAGVSLDVVDPSQRVQGVPPGVLVVESSEDSPAAAAGLVAGDIIIAVGRHPVASIEQLVKATGGIQDVLLLTIRRDDQDRFVAIGPES